MDTQYNTTSRDQPNGDRQSDINLLHKLTDQDFIVRAPPSHSRLIGTGTVTSNSCSIGHSAIYLLGRYNTSAKEKFKNIPNLSIKNRYMSNKHCVLVYGKPLNEDETGWFVADVNSTNGTYANVDNGVLRLPPYKHFAINKMKFFTLAGSDVRYHISVGLYTTKITEMNQIL